MKNKDHVWHVFIDHPTQEFDIAAVVRELKLREIDLTPDRVGAAFALLLKDKKIERSARGSYRLGPFGSEQTPPAPVVPPAQDAARFEKLGADRPRAPTQSVSSPPVRMGYRESTLNDAAEQADPRSRSRAEQGVAEYWVQRRGRPDIWVYPVLPHNRQSAVDLAKHKNKDALPADWVVCRALYDVVWDPEIDG